MLRLASSFVVLLCLGACGTSRTPYAPPGGDIGYSESVFSGGDVDAVQIRGGRSGELVPVRQQSEARQDRKRIRNASLAVAVHSDAEMEAAIDEATALADRLEGYVANEGPGMVTLRIPDRQLEAALDGLGALGRELRRDVRTDDVTMQYADLEVRLANARALQTRLRALLDDAESVQDVLAVEVELARVTADVERLEGQIQFLSNQIAYSTVVFRVQRDSRPGPLGYVVVGAYEAVKWLFVRG